jgi:cytoplasmic iron level regulating protein YaaA (DUF328/UPF0246 family)
MRYLGWVLGGLFLTDGLLGLIGKRDLIKRLNSSVGKKLPSKVGNTLNQATNINDTAVKAMGINNVIAGAGMVLVATLTGLRRRRMAQVSS